MSAPTSRLLTLTDASGVAHLVTDEALAAGHHRGAYLAVCGRRVLAASLAAPEAGYCRACASRGASR